VDAHLRESAIVQVERRRTTSWCGIRPIACLLALGASAGCGARTTLDHDSAQPAADVGGTNAGVAGALGPGGTGASSAGGSGGTAGAAGVATAGAAGLGTAGFAGTAGAAGAPPCPELIDDMEAGTGIIFGCPGRSGAWYSYNDGFGVQFPAPTAPGVPVLPSSISGGRGASARAMFSSYQSIIMPPEGDPGTHWGAGIGVDLNFDGLHYGTYDASAYDGITFWARGTPLTVEARVSTVATTLVKYGGTCPAEFCAPAEGAVTISPDWQQYFVPFHALGISAAGSTEPLGDAFRKDQLTNLQFLYTRNDDLAEFWLDDLAFYVDPTR
jgi:hypothetical protein